MIQISTASLTLILAIITILGAVFSVFFYFQKPQIAQDKKIKALEDGLEDVKKDVLNVKKDHAEVNGGLQKEFKEMTVAMNNLDKTVVRLSTIIEERIPKGSPGLTPPGK